MATKLEFEVELKSSAEKIWKSVGDYVTLYPKAFPDIYQSIEVVEGDGCSPGSIYKVKYAPGLSMISTTTEKIESIDDKNKIMTYTVVDGDVLKYYNNFKGIISVSSKSDGSKVKLSAEFDKASEEGAPGPDLYKKFFTENFQNLDAYLIRA